MQALTNENALMTLNKVAGIQHYATQDADAVAVDIVPTDQAGNFNPNLIKFTDSFFFFFLFRLLYLPVESPDETSAEVWNFASE